MSARYLVLPHSAGDSRCHGLQDSPGGVELPQSCSHGWWLVFRDVLNEQNPLVFGDGIGKHAEESCLSASRSSSVQDVLTNSDGTGQYLCLLLGKHPGADQICKGKIARDEFDYSPQQLICGVIEEYPELKLQKVSPDTASEGRQTCTRLRDRRRGSVLAMGRILALW